MPGRLIVRPLVEADPVQLHQVLAVKLGPKGQAEVPLRPWWKG